MSGIIVGNRYELIEKIRVYIWNLIHLRKGMK